MTETMSMDRAWTEFERCGKQLEEMRERFGEDADDRALAEMEAMECRLDTLRNSSCESKTIYFSLLHETPSARNEWQAVDEKCTNAIKTFVDPGDHPDRWRIYLFADHSVLATGGGGVTDCFHLNSFLERFPGVTGIGSVGQLAEYARSLTEGTTGEKAEANGLDVDD